MDKENTRILLVAVYGNMQHIMNGVGLVSDKGAPLGAKSQNINETEGLDIYKYLGRKIQHLRKFELNFYADKFNEIVGNLINEENLVNNYLMAMMLLRNYLNEEAIPMERIMVGGKVDRQIGVFEKIFAGNKEEYKNIQKVTGRVADNMWRILNDRPQLSDEVRNARAKRFVR